MKDNYIALSLSENTLQAVQLKGKGGGAKVINVVSKDISEVPEGNLPRIISSALHGFNPQKATLFYVIPQSVATTKTIEVPSIDPHEIKSIVSLQAGRHTPFSREEIQVGYVNIGIYNNNYSKVLLVIANKNELRTSLDAIEKSGLQVQKIVFAPEGMARFYSTCLNLNADQAPSGIIDIGQKSTDFIIAYKGPVIFSRNIPIGKTQLVQDSPLLKDKLIDELSQTAASYKNEDVEAEPVKYIITSNDEVSKELELIIKEKFGWDVQLVSYFDKVKVSNGVVKKIGKECPDVSFLTLIGPASTYPFLEVDLMPEEIQMKKAVKLQGKEVFRAAVLGFVLLILGSSILGVKIFFRKSLLNKMKRDYSEQRKAVASLEERSLRTQILSNYLESRMVSLDTIYELYQKVPEEIYLTNLYMDENGKVNIQGISDISSLVFNLGTTLKESELFKSVEIMSTTSKKDRGKDVTSFEISLKLKYALDEEEEAAVENTEENP